MSQEVANRNTTIDLMKYVAAMMIVGIHTQLLSDVNENLGFVVVQVICRLAVPFFALTTGYYLAKQIDEGKKSRFEILKKHWLKIFVIYAVWTAIYFVYTVLTRDESILSIAHWYAVDTVLYGCHYHLWYLLALLFALPLMVVAWRKEYRLPLGVIAVVMYLGYSWIYLHGVTSITAVAGVLMLFPYMLIAGIMNVVSVEKTKIAVVVLLLCLVLQTIEAFYLRSIGYEKWTYIASAMLSGVAFFMMTISIRRTETNDKVMRFESLLGKLSLFVYCAHPIFVELLIDKISSTVVVWIIAIMGASLIGCACNFVGCEFKKSLVKLHE